MHSVLCFFILLILNIECSKKTEEAVDVKILTDQVANKVVGTYVGATLDQGGISSWATELTNNHITMAAKAVPGVIVRIGGTDADFTLFNQTVPGQHTLTPQELDLLCTFVRNAKWKMVFAFNALTRKTGGPWETYNAVNILNYFSQIKCFDVIVGFELGNEPDLYHHRNISVLPSRMAQDFVTLRKLLDSMNIPKESANLWGPDVAVDHSWFGNFTAELKNIQQEDVLNGATFHQYYFSGKGSHPIDYVKPENLDKISETVNAFKALVPAGAPWDLILGETGPSYGGGLQGFTAGFGVTMMWLDKINLGARTGLKRLQRQAYWGGNYGIINRTNTASPDYYIWNIYRNQTDGGNGNILVVDGDTASDRTLRVYARCGNNGDIVLSVINVGDDDQMIQISPTPSEMSVWKFNSACEGSTMDDKLNCQQMKINGHVALQGSDGSIPYFAPTVESGVEQIQVDSYSSIIITLSGIDAKNCNTN